MCIRDRYRSKAQLCFPTAGLWEVPSSHTGRQRVGVRKACFGQGISARPPQRSFPPENPRAPHRKSSCASALPAPERLSSRSAPNQSPGRGRFFPASTGGRRWEPPAILNPAPLQIPSRGRAPAHPKGSPAGPPTPLFPLRGTGQSGPEQSLSLIHILEFLMMISQKMRG